MKQQTVFLVALQAIDSELNQIGIRKKDLPGKKISLEEKLRAVQEKLEQEKSRLDEAARNHKQMEESLRKGIENLKRTKERLLEVKNNKEYQAMLKEIETAEKASGEIETQIIALMEEMDQLAVLVKQDEETLRQAVSEHEREKKNLEDELDAVDADTQAWTEKRADLQKMLPGDLLDRYEKVRKRNNGIGVISVWKSVCNGCHMNIPPQMYNEVQRSEALLSCPNCNRIMYFEDQEKSA